MIPVVGLGHAVMAAKEAAKDKADRGLTDKEKDALAAASSVGRMMGGGGLSHGLGPLAASKLADALKDSRDKRYGSDTREIRGGNPYGYSS